MNDDGWDRVATLSSGVSVGSRWSCDDQGHRFDVLDTIAEFARKPGSIYIHCHAGMCRGPTVAVVALLARHGSATWRIGTCVGLVVDAMLSQYRWFPLAPEFYQPVINEIHHWHTARTTRRPEVAT